MSGRPEARHVVQQWAERAEDDLRSAEYLLTMGQDCPHGAVCFHAQQCVEKYIKGLLAHLAVDFPKTHDIGELLRLLPEGNRPSLSVPWQERLTDYATAARYPGDWESIARGEAEEAVALARSVRDALRGHMPPQGHPA